MSIGNGQGLSATFSEPPCSQWLARRPRYSPYIEVSVVVSQEAHPFPRHIRPEDEGSGDEGGNHATEKSARVASQHLS